MDLKHSRPWFDAHKINQKFGFVNIVDIDAPRINQRFWLVLGELGSAKKQTEVWMPQFELVYEYVLTFLFSDVASINV